MGTLVASLQLKQLLARSDATCSNAISRLHHQSKVSQAPCERTGPSHWGIPPWGHFRCCSPPNITVSQGYPTRGASVSYESTYKVTPPEGLKRFTKQPLSTLRDGWLYLQTKHHIRMRKYQVTASKGKRQWNRQVWVISVHIAVAI